MYKINSINVTICSVPYHIYVYYVFSPVALTTYQNFQLNGFVHWTLMSLLKTDGRILVLVPHPYPHPHDAPWGHKKLKFVLKKK